MNQTLFDPNKKIQQEQHNKIIKGSPQKCYSSLENTEQQQSIKKDNNSYLKLTESNLEAMLRKSQRFLRNSSSFSVLSQKSSSRQLQKSIEYAHSKNHNKISRQILYTQQNQPQMKQNVQQVKPQFQSETKINLGINQFNQQSGSSQLAGPFTIHKQPMENQVASSMSIKYSSCLQNARTPSLSISYNKNKAPSNHIQLVDLQILDQQAQTLINRKLSLLADIQKHNQNFSQSMISLQIAQIDNELRKMISTLKISHSKNNTSFNESIFLSKKIDLIENLLAQNAAEGHLMKKFFANSVSMKEPRKHKTVGNHHIANMVNSFNKLQKSYVSEKIKLPSTLIEPLTTNKTSFKQPNPEDYESYRFKPKDFEPNKQPFPRSSYKRDYLQMNPQLSDKIFEKKELLDLKFKYHNLKSSYHQDFQRLKSESVDYKELDAYRDKFKFIKMSYMPKHAAQITERKKQLKNKSINDIKYIKKLQSSINSVLKTPEKQKKYTEMISESKRSFIWQNNQNIDKSKMKHKNLKQFEYRLKNMYKA